MKLWCKKRDVFDVVALIIFKTIFKTLNFIRDGDVSDPLSSIINNENHRPHPSLDRESVRV